MVKRFVFILSLSNEYCGTVLPRWAVATEMEVDCQGEDQNELLKIIPSHAEENGIHTLSIRLKPPPKKYISGFINQDVDELHLVAVNFLEVKG